MSAGAAGKRGRWLVVEVCTCVVVLLALLPHCVEGFPKYCNKRMYVRNVEDGVIPENTVSLNCEAGGITWKSAKKSHLLSFVKNHKDIVVCLTIKRPGARIYRPKGAQRQLIAGVNDTGFVGCFKSECNHVPFLFELDENYAGPKNLLYEYSGYIDIKCPECTETCQTDCLCGSDFSFHGKLRESTYRTNTYIYYFQVAEFVKYNGVYRDPILAREAGKCPIDDATSNSTSNATDEKSESSLLEDKILAEIPPDGIVRVYAKCPLRLNKTYFVSTTLHVTRNGRPRLLMCCQHFDEHYAMAHLTDLLHRKECCRHEL